MYKPLYDPNNQQGDQGPDEMSSLRKKISEPTVESGQATTTTNNQQTTTKKNTNNH